jgi:hypothetical protein
MSRVSCTIWESCKHQATSTCFHCEDNAFAEEPIEDYYEFNHWQDNNGEDE